MALLTVSDLKAHLGITSSADDALLGAYVSSAQKVIENKTRRIFEPVTQTRYFGPDRLLDSARLRVGDVLSVSAVVDGIGITRTSGQYRLEPLGAEPFAFIRALNNGMGGTWLFDVDALVAITGSWGFSATPPADIVQACKQLSAWLYRQRNTNEDLDRPIISGDGVVLAPAGLPKSVMELIAPYIRREVAG